ncbi:MAG: cellulase family glycosylhydrolase [Candidatus Woesearchaeota archaeon]
MKFLNVNEKSLKSLISKKIIYLLIFLMLSSVSYGALVDFAAVEDGEFYVDGKPFYFAGANNYYLFYKPISRTTEVFDDAVNLNLSVVRTWGFCDGTCSDASSYSFQSSPGVFKESTFIKFDNIIKEASDRGLKLIVPLVNNWDDFGGMCQYVKWCGLTDANLCDADEPWPFGTPSAVHDAFYSDTCTKNMYKTYVNYFLNRVNTVTGIKYKDDPTIFAWELANEPRARSDTTTATLNNWIGEMSAYVKSIDPYHLVTPGGDGGYKDKPSNPSWSWWYHGNEGQAFIDNHAWEDIDFATFRYYPEAGKFDDVDVNLWIQQHAEDAAALGKPVIMEEFGSVSNKVTDIGNFYDQIELNGINGDTVWLLSDHYKDGNDGYFISCPEDAACSVISDHATYMKENTIDTNYSISSIPAGLATEYRFYYEDHHFLTIIDDRGTFNIRPHPGEDINGWGSSLYMQPFLPGATLKHSVVEKFVVYEDGIEVQVSGNVSRYSASKYGGWDANLKFDYDPILKEINGIGGYNVSLAGTLSGSTGDLNLLKLASNYLNDVPLLTGSTGDTGDMHFADVVGFSSFTWDPVAQPAHFPYEKADDLSIDVSGEFNIVDTAAQGYAAIDPAYKPSLKIELNSKNSGIPMIFGGIYDLAKSTYFWEDNIGITPLILTESTDTDFSFDISFFSKALAGDGINTSCFTDSECGTDGYIGSESCNVDDVWQDYRSYSCSNAGTASASCSNSDDYQLKETCTDTCSAGSCVDIVCSSNAECGTDGYVGADYCSADDVLGDWKAYYCGNPGTPSSYCYNIETPTLKETCTDTCSNGSCVTIECYNETECGTPGWIGSPSCKDVYTVGQNYRTWGCLDPGTPSSICVTYDIYQPKESCTHGICGSGACHYVECFADFECGNNSWIGNTSCNGDDVWQDYRSYTCSNPATPPASCGYSDDYVLKETCTDTCSGGSCVDVECYSDSECGTDAWLNNEYCSGNEIWDTYRTNTCSNPGTASASCSYSDVDQSKQTCGDLCENATCVGVECYNDAECGTDSWIGSESCNVDDVWQDYREYSCLNPGTASASCSSSDVYQEKEVCSDTCSSGSCITVACYSDSECGTDSYVGSESCNVDDVWQDYRSYTCSDAGTALASCGYSDDYQEKEICVDTCSAGICVGIVCYSDSDCGTDSWISSPSCNTDDVWQDYRSYTCSDAGTALANCSSSDDYQEKEICADTCSGGSCISVDYPDLNVKSADVLSSNLGVNKFIGLHIVLENKGNVTANNVFWELDTDSSQVNPNYGPTTIEPGKTIDIYPVVKYSAAGDYNLIFYVDLSGLIEEEDETNNEAGIPLTIG